MEILFSEGKIFSKGEYCSPKIPIVKKIRKKDSFVYLLATIRMIIESKINGIDCGVRKCLEKMFPRHKNNRKNNKKISRLISLELFLSKI